MVKREVSNLHKMLRSKKGISPILATLLLIVIAVAAIIVTYAWVMTFIGAQTGAGGTMLDIENVGPWRPGNTTIVVRNIGTSDAKIVRLYLGNTGSNLSDVTASTDLGPGKELPVDQTVSIVLYWPNKLTTATSWTNGKTYYFKVYPETGAPKEFSWTAPSS